MPAHEIVRVDCCVAGAGVAPGAAHLCKQGLGAAFERVCTDDEGVGKDAARDEDGGATSSPANSHEVPSVTDSGSYSDLETEERPMACADDAVAPTVAEATVSATPEAPFDVETELDAARAQQCDLERRCDVLLNALRRHESRLIRDELDLAIRGPTAELDSADVFGFDSETLALCENSVSLLDVGDLFGRGRGDGAANGAANGQDAGSRKQDGEARSQRHGGSSASALLQLSPRERAGVIHQLGARAERLEAVLDADATDVDDEDAPGLEDDPDMPLLSEASNRFDATRRLAHGRLSWLDMRLRALVGEMEHCGPLCGQPVAVTVGEAEGATCARTRGADAAYRAALVRSMAMPPRARNPLAVFADPAHRRIACVDPAFHPILSRTGDIPIDVSVNVALDTLAARPLGKGLRLPREKKKKLRRARRGVCDSDEEGGFVKGRKRSLNNSSSGSLKRPRSEPASLGASHNGLGSSLNSSTKKRKEHSAWDFDNIVIPTSMAASARIEVIQYKEIITPEWRSRVEAQAEPMELEEENVSDEAFARRHHPQELLEKARYAAFVASGRHGAQAGARAPVTKPEAAEGTPTAERAFATPLETPNPTPYKRRRSVALAVPGTPVTPVGVAGAATPAVVAPPLVMRRDAPCGYPPRRFPMTEREFERYSAEGDESARRRARLSGEHAEDASHEGRHIVVLRVAK